jgi:hypothetical protein
MNDVIPNSNGTGTDSSVSDPSTVTPFPTSIEAVRAAILKGSTEMVANLNADLKSRYLSAFNDWAISVNAGKIDNTNPPIPPYAWELAPPNADGLVFYQISTTTRVCDMPPVPDSKLNVPEPPAGTIDLGADLGGGWYAAGPHDRVAPGTIITLPNGLKLQKVGFFMGNGWYQKVS